uniref:Uncharacterized protein n=1 Tax=Bicosoecida sp. CB-2014 TaxID=1486930 RepID=A0A7S1G830_9STRA|mmetsp:Transcript_23604/g.82169  ORF Transcript_23604/g.82169 Transcript_23604/m.82169 type:complete len:170 (+) Transcript_23604:343-852(+)
MPQDTKLHKEAYKGVMGGVQEALRDDGIAVDAPGAGGRTALQRACGVGHHTIVTFLLGAGASPSAVDLAGRTALHWAAVANSETCISAVLDAEGAPRVDAATKSGNTALHMAADAGHLEAVTLLLSRGADATLRNSEGQTAGDGAKLNGHAQVAAALGAGGGGGGCIIL